MKKIVIITTFLSILLTIVLSDFWIVKNEAEVSFDIAGSGVVNTTIRLENSKRKPVAKKNKIINLNKELKNESINLNYKKPVKTFRIILKCAKCADTITFNNICFKSGNFELKNLKDFNVTNAGAKLSDNGIILTQIDKNKPAELKLNSFFVNQDRFYEPFVIISVFVLSFLLFFCIVKYIFNLKLLNNKSRLEIVFLTIFIIFLFLPMLSLNNLESSKFENRTLAKFEPLFKDNSINYNFGKMFNDWFSDHISSRDFFIKTNIALKCTVNNYCTSSSVYFDKKNESVYEFSGGGFIKLNEDKYFDNYITSLKKYKEFCDSRGIKLYFLIAPKRNAFLTPSAAPYNISHNERDEVIPEIMEKASANFVFPYKEFELANKSTPVYFKTDGHWTKKGAYISYKELMKVIKKDFPGVNILEEDSLTPYYDNMVQAHWNQKKNVGDLFKYLGLPKFMAKKYLNTKYLYYKNPDADKLKTGIFSELSDLTNFDEEFYYPDGADLKVMLIANSFGRNLVEFLPYSFKHTLRLYDNYRYMNFDTYKKFIDEYKPDIIIINIHSFDFCRLLNLYSDKNWLFEPEGEGK